MDRHFKLKWPTGHGPRKGPTQAQAYVRPSSQSMQICNPSLVPHSSHCFTPSSMEILKPRFLEKHLRTLLSPSALSRFSPSNRRASQTLPPRPLLSFRAAFSPASSQSRHRTNPSPRLFSSLSAGKELDWRDDHRNPPRTSPAQALNVVSESDEAADKYHLLEVQQQKEGRFIPVKSYFLSTRFLPFSLHITLSKFALDYSFNKLQSSIIFWN